MGRVPGATMGQITSASARAFDISTERLFSPERTKEVVAVRFAAALAIHRLTKKSLAEIGRHMNRDHTSIGNALLKASHLERTDPDWRSKFDSISTILYSAHSSSLQSWAMIANHSASGLSCFTK